MRYPGSGVVLDCIDILIFATFLTCLNKLGKRDKNAKIADKHDVQCKLNDDVS